MGCIPGEEITVDQIAPLKDPISVIISGYRLSLRLNEAEKIIVESYELGGGQFKDWYNQADLEKKKSKEFQAWMQFYFNKERCEPIKDKQDRNFWIDKKWLI